MPLSLKQTVALIIEPVGLDEAKEHLRVDHRDDDALLTRRLRSAREFVESQIERQLITATYELKIDRFPPFGRVITLPRPPLQSVESIKYKDTDDVEQTWSASEYVVDTHSEPGRVFEADGEDYPTDVNIDERNVVTITYKAGYGDNRSDVPEDIKDAILFTTELLYDRPEGRSEEALRRALHGLLWSNTIPTVR